MSDGRRQRSSMSSTPRARPSAQTRLRDGPTGYNGRRSRISPTPAGPAIAAAVITSSRASCASHLGPNEARQNDAAQPDVDAAIALFACDPQRDSTRPYSAFGVVVVTTSSELLLRSHDEPEPASVTQASHRTVPSGVRYRRRVPAVEDAAGQAIPRLSRTPRPRGHSYTCRLAPRRPSRAIGAGASRSPGPCALVVRAPSCGIADQPVALVGARYAMPWKMWLPTRAPRHRRPPTHVRYPIGSVSGRYREVVARSWSRGSVPTLRAGLRDEDESPLCIQNSASSPAHTPIAERRSPNVPRSAGMPGRLPIELPSLSSTATGAPFSDGNARTVRATPSRSGSPTRAV